MLVDGKQKIAHYLALFVHQHLFIPPLLFVSPEIAWKPPIVLFVCRRPEVCCLYLVTAAENVSVQFACVLKFRSTKGLFTWRWGTPGRWDNMWRVMCKHDHIKMRDYMDRQVTYLSGLPHLPWVPHLHVNRLLVRDVCINGCQLEQWKQWSFSTYAVIVGVCTVVIK